jgi:BAI1-associated protein 3
VGFFSCGLNNVKVYVVRVRNRLISIEPNTSSFLQPIPSIHTFNTPLLSHSSPNLAEASFLAKGAVVIFTVWNYETMVPNDFLGELVIPMSHARQMNAKQTIDDTAAMILPLQRPKEPTDGPFRVSRKNSDLVS